MWVGMGFPVSVCHGVYVVGMGASLDCLLAEALGLAGDVLVYVSLEFQGVFVPAFNVQSCASSLLAVILTVIYLCADYISLRYYVIFVR